MDRGNALTSFPIFYIVYLLTLAAVYLIGIPRDFVVVSLSNKRICPYGTVICMSWKGSVIFENTVSLRKIKTSLSTV